jgi:peroxin-19
VTIPEDIADEDAEFARQFAAEMEAFMKGLTSAGGLSQATDASSSSNSTAALPDPEELRKAWEKMLVEDLEADPASSLGGISGVPGPSSGKVPPGSTVIEDTFQRAVKQTMEKLKESDDTIKVQTHPVQYHLLLLIGCRRTKEHLRIVWHLCLRPWD